MKKDKQILKTLIIGALRAYQLTLSPDHGMFAGHSFSRCRFFPSCSAYATEAFRQYGLFRALVVSLWRVGRCHPFSRGGYDPITLL